MAGLRVQRIDNLSTGGGAYRLHFTAAAVPPLPATLFARFENGTGLFMTDQGHPNFAKVGGQWLIVAADGEVIQTTKTVAFTLRRKAE